MTVVGPIYLFKCQNCNKKEEKMNVFYDTLLLIILHMNELKCNHVLIRNVITILYELAQTLSNINRGINFQKFIVFLLIELYVTPNFA